MAKLIFYKGGLCGESKCISWGQHQNLSYAELSNKLFNIGLAKALMITQEKGRNLKGNITFIPRYGFCKEISDYDPTKQINVINREESTAEYLLLTDHTEPTSLWIIPPI